MNINTLTIEITRKCNYECNHCLRGNSQERNIDTKYIDSLFSVVDSVDEIVFTGGEPFLNPEAIIYTINLIMRKKIDVGSFFIATNGSVFDIHLMHNLNVFRTYCNTPDACVITVSFDDGWHEDWLNYKESSTRQENICLFEGYSFYTEAKRSFGQTHKVDNLLVEGKGIDQTNNKPPVHTSILEIEDDTVDEIYLNATGWINNDCNLSFLNQGLYRICKVEQLAEYCKKSMAEAI